jgi:hypothetical protein
LGYISLKSTGTVRKLFTATWNFVPVREIRRQRINICLYTVLVQGKFPGPGRNYLFTSGLPTLGIFPPKKKILRFLSKTFWAFFRPIYDLLKCQMIFKKLSWQPCFHRTGTFQWKVPPNDNEKGQNTIFKHFKIENENFKILNPSSDD